MIRICLIVIIILSACKGRDYIPSDILPKLKMQIVLADVIKAESVTQEMIKKDSLLNSDSLNVFHIKEIFAIHKITKNDFDKSFNFYEKNPVLMREIVDSIQAHQADIIISDTIIKNKLKKPLIKIE